MKTIVVIARSGDWEKAKASGQYTCSTIDSSLEEVGFLHCSFPAQTLEIANRRYAGNTDLMLLLVDAGEVAAPIKYEGALSGRAGTFAHIYGPLNVSAVYATCPLAAGRDGKFVVPAPLLKALE